MTKKLIIVLGLSSTLMFTACFGNPTEDVYNTDEVTTETTELSTSTVIEGAETGTTESITSETGATGVEEVETVSSDVYEEETAPQLVTVGELSVSEISSNNIDDPVLKEKMSKFLDPFYFSLYFGNRDYSETGITEDDMVLFALSYCYLHENQAYKFDATDFKLYVPEERVLELVDKYFGVQLTGHHTIVSEEDNISIEYNGGYYLVPTSDVGWNDTMRIDTIKKAGDFAYEVVFTILDIEEKPVVSKMVILETRDDRFILSHYEATELVSDDEGTEGTDASEEFGEVTDTAETEAE